MKISESLFEYTNHPRELLLSEIGSCNLKQKIKHVIRLTAPTSLLSSPMPNATVATTFIKKLQGMSWTSNVVLEALHHKIDKLSD